MALAVFAIANDFTAMNVVLPAIEGDLDTDLSTVQWVVNGYALVLGVLIVPGGRLADVLGRSRILYVRAAIFATFSLLGGLAPNVELLIASRALMGVGGALMWPAILGLIYELLPAIKAGLAGGLVIGVAMAGFVLRERSAGESGLIPPSVMGNGPFLWACTAVLAMSATFFATLLYLPQFFQKILVRGTLGAGLMLLPFVGVFAAASFAETCCSTASG